MKKIISLILALSFSLFAINAFAYENAVYDNADLFTDSQELSIASEADSFSSLTDFSLAIVTINYAEGKTSEEYADDFLDFLIDTNGWQEDSVLFLVDLDNRNVWISTTGEAIFAYNDYEIDLIIDGGYESLSNGDYYDAIIDMISAAEGVDAEFDEENDFFIADDESFFADDDFSGGIIQFEDDYYQYDDNGGWIQIDDAYSGYQPSPKVISLSDVFIYLIIGLIIGAVSALIVKSQYKNMGKGDEFNVNDISLKVTASNDNIISRNVVTAKIPRNNNRTGGSSRGGGSSVHRSSGGRSHGGGGRKF